MEERAQICVIGAGPSGLAAAKNAIQFGFDVVVFEQNEKVGGNWVFQASTGHSSVYEHTHIISSKVWSEYEDYPMPDDYPDYPSHSQLQAYFAAYARYFGVMEHIRFNHTVTAATRTDAGLWAVAYNDEAGNAHTALFDQLMVANGHHWNPKYPEYPGEFTGIFMHSHDFKRVDETWRGKRVLVIGAGNSACDVAVEAARVAEKVCLSMRSPQWFLPKFLFGMPTDVFASYSNWMPNKLKQFTLTKLLTLLEGPYSRYGLPTNTHPALSHHPTLNSDLLDYIRHGRIHPRPAIRQLAGDEVTFVDGEVEAFDIICACTGFWITFPFFEQSFIDFQHVDKVPLFLRMMHPDYTNLYFIGLFQPLGCIWPLADYQAMLACAEIAGIYQRPADLKTAIQYEIEHPHFEYTGGLRHSTEVDYHGLRRELSRELQKAGIAIGKPPQGKKSLYKKGLVKTAENFK